MDRVLWILLVISLSVIASVLGATLANALKGRPKRVGKKRRRGRFDDDDDELDTTRNAPKGAAAVVFWVLGGLGCGGLTCLAGMSLVIILAKAQPDPDPNADRRDDGPIVHNDGNKPGDLLPKEKETQILGGADNQVFRDEAPGGGLLIGFDVGLGKAFGVELVKAIQPRYRTAQGEAAGRKYGRDFAKVVSVRAKPGYAVGAINVKAGLVVNGFSVIFLRVNGDRLDKNDSYTSQWIGDRTGGGGPTLLAGEGAPIVGIIGKHNANDCTGLGLLRK